MLIPYLVTMSSHRILMLLIFIYICLLSDGCKDEKCGRSRDIYVYEFKIPVTISPVSEEYSVGDTITLKVDIPKRLTDHKHNLVENVVSHNIFHSSWVNNVRGDFTNLDATVFIGVLLGGGTVGSLQIEEFSGSSIVSGQFGDPINNEMIASLRYRFILRQTGVYWFTFSGQQVGNEQDGPLLSIANMCPNGSVKYVYEVNDGADNNFAILCQTEDVFCTPTYSEDNHGVAFDDRAGYVFKVTE